MTHRPNGCANPNCLTEQGHRKSHPNAFCAECFEPRFCGGGNAERMLTCVNCGKRTLHVVTGMTNQNDPYDYGDAKFWHPDAPWTHIRYRKE